MCPFFTGCFSCLVYSLDNIHLDSNCLWLQRSGKGKTLREKKLTTDMFMITQREDINRPQAKHWMSSYVDLRPIIEEPSKPSDVSSAFSTSMSYKKAPPLLAGLQWALLLLASLHRTFASFIFVLTNFCFFYLCIN